MPAQQTTRRVENSPAYHALVRTGLVSYGIVHLVIAWLALQLAFGKSDQQASQQGAMQELGEKPLGGVLLWVVGIGLFALALWQLIDAIAGQHQDEDKKKEAAGRLKSVGKAVVYIVIGIQAVKATGGSSGGGQEKTMTAKLMEAPAGRVLVAIVGLVILIVGIYHVYKAVTAKFTENLVGGVGTTTIALGRAGYGSKGVALAIVGVLFGWSAITYDPNKAGGLDSALRRLKDAPAGPVLLTLIALGIACFGVYCFVWARKVKI